MGSSLERMVGGMSFLPKSEKSLPAILLLFVLIVASAHPSAVAAGESFAGFRPLPDVLVRSLATSQDVHLAKALAGRPAVLLLTDGSGPRASPVGRVAADLQRDYAPWFS